MNVPWAPRVNYTTMLEDLHLSDFQQPRWYALFVRSNQEKKVAEALRGREVECLLPCYQSVRQWKDRRMKLEIPLFSGYVFVHLPLVERLKALTVCNVVSLVGTRNQPSPISEEEIAWIKLGIEHGKVQPHPYLKLGERVVVTEGVMRGMEGVLLERRNSARIVVALDSISRAFTVEIAADCVRPVGNSAATCGYHPGIEGAPDQVGAAGLMSQS